MNEAKAPPWLTSNISLVAALGALGFTWHDPKAPCRNVYGKDDPIPRDRQGRPTKPGNNIFSLSRESEEFPNTQLKEILNEWQGGDGDEHLDRMIEPDADDLPEVAKLKQGVAKILPFAIMRYMKGCLSNRKEAAGMFRNVKPMRSYEEDGHLILIDADASDETKHKLGVAL